MTNPELHALMKKCKKGARIGIMTLRNAKVSLMWWYGSDHHSEEIGQYCLDAESPELFNALERATKAMK